MSENAVNYTRFGEEGLGSGRREREREKKIEEIGRSTRIFKEDERSGNTDVDVEIRKFSRVLVPA